MSEDVVERFAPGPAWLSWYCFTMDMRKVGRGIFVGFVAASGIAIVFVLGIWLGGAPDQPSVISPSPPPAPIVAEHTPPPEPDPLTPDQLTLVAWALESRALAALEGDALIAELEDWAVEAVDVSYAQLERNAEDHRHERAVFRGRILEIRDTSDGGTYMRLATRGYHNVLWVETPIAPDSALVERSRVRVYGYLMGMKGYQSQAGWQLTIPQMAAVAVVPSSTPRRLSAARRARLQGD